VAVIQVVANQPGAGKTCLIGAMLAGLRRQGRRAGYFRPFSPTPQEDPDVEFFLRKMLVEEGDPPVPSPQATPAVAPAPAWQGALREAAASLQTAADVVLLEGPDLGAEEGAGRALANQVADLLDSKVVLVVRYYRGLSAAHVAALAGPLGQRLSGVVINSFPPHRRQEVEKHLIPALKSRGLPALGAIPDDRYMLAVTVQQIADHLQGRWVQEPVNTDALVDRFLMGGNIMDSGPNYFGRYQNQAVITRSERIDIQMASLMCATRCMVLTGGAPPAEYVRVEAAAREVPLILVDLDTMSTAEALAGLQERASAHNLEKVCRFRELMSENLDAAALGELLGT
jgi:uncharacterized protein